MPAVSDQAKIRWEDGDVPVSPEFDDPYFSREDGLAETRHVFLDGNRLTERWQGAKGFHIAELGFGTGLNLLAAWHLWDALAEPGAVLDYTSFEIAPLSAEEMSRATARWPELEDRRRALIDAWPARRAPIDFGSVRLTIVEGDANRKMADWRAPVDAWFLDGFAPARNPELWNAGLLQRVFDRTRPGGTFATYTAAGHVRRSLQGAGFDVRRLPGFGTKREMLAGSRAAAS